MWPLTYWKPSKELQIVGLESIHHNWWNPPLCIQQQEQDVYLPILRHSKHSYFKYFKRSQKNQCPWVCSLILFLELSLFGVLLFLLGRRAWRTLTSMWTPFHSLRIFLPIPKEYDKISRITWILVFIIVLRESYLVDLPLSPNTPCNFKENIIDYGKIGRASCRERV